MQAAVHQTSLLEACGDLLLGSLAPTSLEGSCAAVWQQLTGGHAPGTEQQLLFLVRGTPRLELSRALASSPCSSARCSSITDAGQPGKGDMAD